MAPNMIALLACSKKCSKRNKPSPTWDGASCSQ